MSRLGAMLCVALTLLCLSSCQRPSKAAASIASQQEPSTAGATIPAEHQAPGAPVSASSPAESLAQSTTIMLSTTPVKQQGQTEACWIYAYLACMETERIEQYGDSLNLSPLWLMRAYYKELARESYLSQAQWPVSMRNIGPEAERLLFHYGVVPYSNYCYDNVNTRVISRDIEQKIRLCINGKTGLKRAEELTEEALPRLAHNLQEGFYLYSMHYTPKQFGNSIQQGISFSWLTSYTHHPYGKPFILEVPDNRSRYSFHNVPVANLVATVITSLKNRHPVYWEGDMRPVSRGKAHLSINTSGALKGNIHQITQERQRHFERFSTTDQHAMAIVGITNLPGKGKNSSSPYFILKNSWGKEWGHKGFCYMSLEDFILRTVCVGVII